MILRYIIGILIRDRNTGTVITSTDPEARFRGGQNCLVNTAANFAVFQRLMKMFFIRNEIIQ